MLFLGRIVGKITTTVLKGVGVEEETAESIGSVAKWVTRVATLDFTDSAIDIATDVAMEKGGEG